VVWKVNSYFTQTLYGLRRIRVSAVIDN